jgi:hypothetical protein
MFFMRGLVLGFIAGAASLYGSMCFHIVRASDGHHVVAKSALTFRDTYVDVRSFDVGEWRNHVPLAEAIMKANKPELMQGAAESALRNAFDGLWDRQGKVNR